MSIYILNNIGNYGEFEIKVCRGEPCALPQITFLYQ